MMKHCVLISELLTEGGINITSISEDQIAQRNIQEIFKWVNGIQKSIYERKTKTIFDDVRKTIKGQLLIHRKNEFHYEFSENDFERVQVLINELRELISKSSDFDDDYKFRLLKKLEKLQSELHKKASDLDRAWGLILDAGVNIGRFGISIEPLVKRFQELADIFWRTQRTSEGLPEGPSPKLLDIPINED